MPFAPLRFSSARRARFIVLATAALLATACSPGLIVPESATIACTADEGCPPPRVCVQGLGECRDPGSSCIEQRNGVFDVATTGAPCALGDAGDGICLAGECLASTCGDRYVDLGRGEACDDGPDNADAPNRCRLSCALPACGDRIVDAGEVCDDGNTASADGCRGDCGKEEVCGDGVIDAGETCEDPLANANPDVNPDVNPNDGCDACRLAPWTAVPLAGGADLGVDPLDLSLGQPAGLAVDAEGTLFVGDEYGRRIWRVDLVEATAWAFAGTGQDCSQNQCRNGVEAPRALVMDPRALAIDLHGNLLFADRSTAQVRVVDRASNVLVSFAGVGGTSIPPWNPIACGDFGDARDATLSSPYGVSVARNGDVLIADFSYRVVRRVSAQTNVIWTIAGSGALCAASGDPCGDGGAASAASFRGPASVAEGPGGEIYIADPPTHRVRMIDAGGFIWTVAGSIAGPGNGGDGQAATAAQLDEPSAVAVGPDGALVIADTGNHRLRIVRDGTIDALAGDGAPCLDAYGACGDGGPASLAQLAAPRALAFDAAGNLFVSDGRQSLLEPSGNRVRRIDAATLDIDRVAGSGGGLVSPEGRAGTTVDAAGGYLGGPLGGRVLFTAAVYVLAWDPDTGLLEVVAGNGDVCVSDCPEGVPAREARLAVPGKAVADAEGNIYFTETLVPWVRRVDAITGALTTYAGDGSPCAPATAACGDGGDAAAAQLAQPGALAVDAQGDLYIGDAGTHRVRVVRKADHQIATIAGTGATAFNGDGVATTVNLSYPSGLALSGAVLYVADFAHSRVRAVDLTGTPPSLTTVAGGGVACAAPCGDDGPATAVTLASCSDVAVDAAGNLFIAERGANAVRRVDAQSRLLTTVAGTGGPGNDGDGGPAPAATIDDLLTVTVAGANTVLFADDDGRVRRVDPRTQQVATVIGPVDGLGAGPFATARLGQPLALAPLPDGGWLVADGDTGQVRLLDLAAAAMSAVAGYPDGFADGADPEQQARFSRPLLEAAGVAVDPAGGYAYVTERGRHTIRRIALVDGSPAAWTIEPFAGRAGAPGADDAGEPSLATFRAPAGLALDVGLGILFVADSGNHTVRRIDLRGGAVTTFAGRAGVPGGSPDDLPAADTLLQAPQALAVDRRGGALYVADTGNHRVLVIPYDGLSPQGGRVARLVGFGQPGPTGSGAPARLFPVDTPRGLAVDGYGDLFIAARASVVRLVPDATGVVSPESAVAPVYGSIDAARFPELATRCLSGIGVLPGDASLLVADACAGLLLRLDRSAVP